MVLSRDESKSKSGLTKSGLSPVFCGLGLGLGLTLQDLKSGQWKVRFENWNLKIVKLQIATSRRYLFLHSQIFQNYFSFNYCICLKWGSFSCWNILNSLWNLVNYDILPVYKFISLDHKVRTYKSMKSGLVCPDLSPDLDLDLSPTGRTWTWT